MAYADRVRDVTTSSGTGNVTLSGTPPATYRALSNIGATGTTFDYCMEDGTNYEIGVGTTLATANTFSRTPVFSSNGNAAVNFPVGTNFYITASAASLSGRVRVRLLSLSGAQANPAINTDLYDRVTITGLSSSITSFTTNLTGSPVAGDTLTIDITDDGASRAIVTFGAKFESSSILLPVNTVANTKMTLYFDWNPASSKWRLVGYV